ncbi:Hypothetical predicted protein [Olea europaea subsp. europaea]|uniref:Uncharacterized protein n=1 Tax=Olea europaea subsp. europaea TaxID=158383 RepID=A0A8S0UPN0_OLEEU|nr:Hypothetical predicted protein [Olea europaea subsp. europaea]
MKTTGTIRIVLALEDLHFLGNYNFTNGLCLEDIIPMLRRSAFDIEVNPIQNSIPRGRDEDFPPKKLFQSTNIAVWIAVSG